MFLQLLMLATVSAASISPAEIKADVRILSSDEFAERGPGEQGEIRTLECLKRAFAAAGLNRPSIMVVS